MDLNRSRLWPTDKRVTISVTQTDISGSLFQSTETVRITKVKSR